MRNLRSCIKVALDFVSPESLPQLEQLARDRRVLALQEDEDPDQRCVLFSHRSCCGSMHGSMHGAAALGESRSLPVLYRCACGFRRIVLLRRVHADKLQAQLMILSSVSTAVQHLQQQEGFTE